MLNDRNILIAVGIIMMAIAIGLVIAIIREGIQIWPLLLTILALIGGACVAVMGSRTKEHQKGDQK
jgi:hypothetical protein